jgi:hypothetical protein
LRVALAAICLVATPAAFAALGDVGFAVGISENGPVLENPNNPSIKMSEMWDTSSQRIMARNTPWIEIANLGGSTGNLLSLDITIGDTRFNFDDSYFGALIQTSASNAPGAIASATTIDGDMLSLTFGNGGLAPGQTVYFRIDIGSDTMDVFQMADFRTVMFDMNGVNVYDNLIDNSDADNSLFTATFVDPNNLAMTAMAETRLPDFDVDGLPGQYFNQSRRPYGQMEDIDIFRATGLNQAGVIPEPTSIAMAMGAAVVGVIVARRRRG